MAATDLLQRSVSDARVAGVCGGIAERYRIDPLLVRIVAVIIALSSGVGFVLYGAAWLLLPRGGEQPALVRAFPTVDRVRGRTWIVLVAGAVVVVLVVVGSAFDISLMPTMVVLGILYASQLRPGSRSAVQSAGTPTFETTPGHAAQPLWPLMTPPPGDLVITTPAGPWRPTNRWGQPLSAQDCATYFSVPDPVRLYERRVPAPPQRRSRVLAVISGLAIAAFFAMLSLLGAFVRVPPVTYLAAGLILVGVALVVGAFLGRPRGFIAIATALILIASFQSASTTDAAAEPPLTPTSSAEMPSDVALSGTDYTLDLSGLQADAETHSSIHMTRGNVIVILPKDGNYTLTWNVTSGKVTMPDGTYTSSTSSLEASPHPNRPMTTISVDVLWGDLVIV